MEQKQDKQQTVTRLALCAVIAVMIYVAVVKFGDKLPLPERCRPRLEQNKVQAIAIIAAILFGLSLVVLPPSRHAEVIDSPPPEDCDPCLGYERTD